MYRIYKVENETNLDEIAQKFNTTVEELERINGTNVLTEFIIVPSNGDGFFDTYIVKQGDNIYEIARKNNINYINLLNLNGLDKDQYIYPNQEILIPKENVLFKITEEGETLASLANELNTSINEIIMQNENIYLSPEQLIVYKKRD